jgi:hypothetical protein
MITKLAVEPIEIISSIDTVNATRTSAVTIESKGSYPAHNIRFINEVWAT